tara:strand:+ start:384 stop:1187 length:804 start_codon:yes stop_codon:yes gene_type:complete
MNKDRFITESYGSTDVGLVRDHNEDFYFIHKSDIQKDYSLLIVADGMGGHEAGEVASELSVKCFVDEFEKLELKNVSNIQKHLSDSLKNANSKVFDKSRETETLGMGTTFTAVLLYKHKLFFAHVGDSRAYILRSEKIIQLTQDHSWVAEQVALGIIKPDDAINHPKSNIITRAIGLNSEVEVDVSLMNVYKGDIVLICSDGLSGLVSDKSIEEVVSINDFQEVPDKLIEIANQNGGTDNITVLVGMVKSGINYKTKKSFLSKLFKN